MGKAPSGLDVLDLRAFVATAEQDDDRIAALLEIYPISGTVVDAQLTDPLSDRFRVADMAVSQPSQTQRDHCASSLILEIHTPLVECLGLLYRVYVIFSG